MLSSNDIKVFQCAYDDQFKHILQKPLSLSCGHSICLQCSTKSIEIRCRHCNEINKNDLKNSKVSQGVKYLIDSSLHKLFLHVENRFEESINRFRDNLFEENLTCKIEFLKEEIDIRVESLKNELELIRIELNKELDQIKENIVKKVLKKYGNKSESELLNVYELNLSQLADENKKLVDRTEDKLCEYENLLRQLNEINSDIAKTNFELKFKPADNLLDKSMIGSIVYNNRCYIQFGTQSSILNEEELNELFALCEFPVHTRLRLLYRGTRDGFESANFHSKSDNNPNTLSLVQTSNGHVFGGFTTQLWNHCKDWKTDPQSFLISFKNKLNKSYKFNVQKPEYAIYCDNGLGPSFGGGSDFRILTNSNTSATSYTKFPYSYAANGITDDQYFLAGSYKFQVKELEVYRVD